MAQGLGIKYRCLLTKYAIAQAARMETAVQQSSNSLGTPRLDYEAWRDFLRSFCGCSSEGINPNIVGGPMQDARSGTDDYLPIPV
jgi:hypothetical protein